MNYGSTRQRSLYFTAPQFIKEAIATAYGMQQRRTRYGVRFREALAQLRDSEYRSNGELRERQYREAAVFIDQALKDSQYYRDHPEYSTCWQARDISQLPVLRKEQVRNYLSELYSNRRSAIPHRWQHTSGTTGQSLTFPIAMACFQREYAFRAFHLPRPGRSGAAAALPIAARRAGKAQGRRDFPALKARAKSNRASLRLWR